MTGRQNHCNREARDCTMNMNIHVVRVDIDIHGLGFDRKCSPWMQVLTQSAWEIRIALDLNLNNLMKNMILLAALAVAVAVLLVLSDAMAVGESRLATRQV